MKKLRAYKGIAIFYILLTMVNIIWVCNLNEDSEPKFNNNVLVINDKR